MPLHIEETMAIRDIRDSVVRVIRGLDPSPEAAILGLMNVLGMVIAERAGSDRAERERLITLSTAGLTRYVDAYTRDNPLKQ
jgi:hypothetical protein